jgi:hypothetical protein
MYRAFFDALSNYPGPKLWAISDIPRAYYWLQDELPDKILKMHEIYGPVIRIAPSELSYCSEDSW